MLSWSFKIQHSRVVWDDWTFQCHQITICIQTRSNWGHFRYKWRSNGGQTPFPWTLNNEGKWGVNFGVFEGAKLKSGLKNNEHHTGGHLGKKSGGQRDLHSDNFDVGCNIVKWVSFSGELMHLDSNPSLKNVYIILEVTWVKSGGQGDLHFDNFDVKLNIVK